MKIVLDTNCFGPIAAPERYDSSSDTESARVIRRQVLDGMVSAFVAETSFALEALPRATRIDQLLRAWATNPARVNVPEPDPVRVQVLNAGLKLGIRVLHAPRIGLPTYAGIPSSAWADDVPFSQKERQTRFFHAIDRLGDQSLEELKALGLRLASVHDLQGPMKSWQGGLVAEFDRQLEFSSKQKLVRYVRDQLAESADVDCLAATFAYGIHRFCSQDHGKGSGPDSVLHDSKRARLQDELDVTVLSMSELADELCSESGG